MNQKITTSRVGTISPSTRPQYVGREMRRESRLGMRIGRRERMMNMMIYASENSENTNDDDDFEARLAALKKAKGETPYGAGVKRGMVEKEEKRSYAAPVRDYSDETLYFESGPHLGDLAVNVALGATLLWLPLSIAAVGRAAFIKYKFTDRRISSITTAPWKTEQVDAAYEEVVDVKSIGRGVGLWGDMVVTLKDGSKLEMRALPKYKELQDYILERRDALRGSEKSRTATTKVGGDDDSRGFA